MKNRKQNQGRCYVWPVRDNMKDCPLVSTCIHVHEHIQIHTHTHLHSPMNTYTHVPNAHEHIHTTHAYTHTCMCTDIHTQTEQRIKEHVYFSLDKFYILRQKCKNDSSWFPLISLWLRTEGGRDVTLLWPLWAGESITVKRRAWKPRESPEEEASWCKPILLVSKLENVCVKRNSNVTPTIEMQLPPIQPGFIWNKSIISPSTPRPCRLLP